MKLDESRLHLNSPPVHSVVHFPSGRKKGILPFFLVPIPAEGLSIFIARNLQFPQPFAISFPFECRLKFEEKSAFLHQQSQVSFLNSKRHSLRIASYCVRRQDGVVLKMQRSWRVMLILLFVLNCSQWYSRLGKKVKESNQIVVQASVILRMKFNWVSNCSLESYEDVTYLRSFWRRDKCWETKFCPKTPRIQLFFYSADDRPGRKYRCLIHFFCKTEMHMTYLEQHKSNMAKEDSNHLVYAPFSPRPCDSHSIPDDLEAKKINLAL
ncbi:hypothetical protein DM860_018171 [Cuscuta australis]|uniref:Uncharacterized protein n=1 Tax=Cuscuta australis TaxID=267555 RepID=A0A328DK53_9ASTE|nr:hypothetical protein DM860_018171 [Cuscuta australis]